MSELLDRVVDDLKTRLPEHLSWLNKVYGRAYPMFMHRVENQKFFYPAAYIGNGEYLSLLPDDQKGNFCWLDVYDPQTIQMISRATVTYNCAIVFWLDTRDLAEDADDVETESLKLSILEAITKPGLIRGGVITPTAIYERPEYIYKGYTIEKLYAYNARYVDDAGQDVEKQYFMRPYYALRIELTIKVKATC